MPQRVLPRWQRDVRCGELAEGAFVGYRLPLHSNGSRDKEARLRDLSMDAGWPGRRQGGPQSSSCKHNQPAWLQLPHVACFAHPPTHPPTHLQNPEGCAIAEANGTCRYCLSGWTQLGGGCVRCTAADCAACEPGAPERCAACSVPSALVNGTCLTVGRGRGRKGGQGGAGGPVGLGSGAGAPGWQRGWGRARAAGKGGQGHQTPPPPTPTPPRSRSAPT